MGAARRGYARNVDGISVFAWYRENVLIYFHIVLKNIYTKLQSVLVLVAVYILGVSIPKTEKLHLSVPWRPQNDLVIGVVDVFSIF